MPLQELIKCLKNAPPYIRETVNKLKYNSLINVCIGLNKPETRDITWLYVPEKDVLFNRVVFLNNYSKYSAPEGKSSLLVETTYNEGDEISQMTDEELLNNAIEGLHKKNLINKKDVCYKKIFKTKYAYIVFDINYNKNLKIVMDYLDNVGIKCCGRFAEYLYINMDQCITRAKNLAQELTDKHGQ